MKSVVSIIMFRSIALHLDCGMKDFSDENCSK